MPSPIVTVKQGEVQVLQVFIGRDVMNQETIKDNYERNFSCSASKYIGTVAMFLLKSIYKSIVCLHSVIRNTTVGNRRS